MTSGVADIKSMVWNPVVFVRVLCFFCKLLVAAMASNVRRIVLLGSTQLILMMNMLSEGDGAFRNSPAPIYLSSH